MTGINPVFSRRPPPGEGGVPAWRPPVQPPKSAPWELRPPDGFDFQTQAQATLGIGPSVTALGVFVTAPRYKGVIREVVYKIAPVLATTVVTFELRINQQTVAGFQYTVFPVALALDIVEFTADSTMIPIPNGPQQIDFLVRVTDAAVYLVDVYARGWFYPEELEAAYRAS